MNLRPLNTLVLNAGLPGVVVVPPVEVPPIRDWDVYEAIQETLRATGAFCLLLFGEGPDTGKLAAQDSPAIVITPRRFTQRTDGNERTIFRTVWYDATVIIHEDDPESAYKELDRLGAVVINSLQGSSNGSRTFEEYSNISGGRHSMNRHPEWRLSMAAQFAYDFEMPTGLSTEV